MAHGGRVHALLGYLPDYARHQYSEHGDPDWLARRRRARGVIRADWTGGAERRNHGRPHVCICPLQAGVARASSHCGRCARNGRFGITAELHHGAAAAERRSPRRPRQHSSSRNPVAGKRVGGCSGACTGDRHTVECRRLVGIPAMATHAAPEAARMIHPLALFWIMFRAALLSTSGSGNLPIVHQDLLARGWATERQFGEALAIGQIGPGPTGLWVISLGYLVDGLRGAALTLLAIVLPPLLVLLLVHGIYARLGDPPATQGFVRGLGLAVSGIFVVVMARIMNSAGWTPINLMIMLGAVALGATRRVPVLLILVLAALVGIGLF